MDDLDKLLEESLKDPEFAAEWEAQEPQRELIGAILDARKEADMSQTELTEAANMKASNLCRLENGNGNPSLSTLGRIAKGLGKKLEIRFA